MGRAGVILSGMDGLLLGGDGDIVGELECRNQRVLLGHHPMRAEWYYSYQASKNQ